MGTSELNVNRLTATFSSNFGARYEQYTNKRHGHEPTKCIEQKTLTDHDPKRIRRYDGTHVNIASYNTDSNMAETEL